MSTCHPAIHPTTSPNISPNITNKCDSRGMDDLMSRAETLWPKIVSGCISDKEMMEYMEIQKILDRSVALARR